MTGKGRPAAHLGIIPLLMDKFPANGEKWLYGASGASAGQRRGQSKTAGSGRRPLRRRNPYFLYSVRFSDSPGCGGNSADYSAELEFFGTFDENRRKIGGVEIATALLIGFAGIFIRLLGFNILKYFSEFIPVI